MRGSFLIAVLVFSAVLAGCAGKGGDSSTSSTSTLCSGCCFTAGSSGACHSSPATTTTTSGPPNVPPVIKVKVGTSNNTTNVTFTGGTLYFDASASTDSDGDGLSAIAMGAIQGNESFAPTLLYSKGKFITGNYTFSKPGIVNVTVSGIDVRGDVTTIHLKVFVDSKVTVGATFQFTGAEPAAVASAKTCKGPTGGQNMAADNLVWTSDAFDLLNGTTYVTATVVSGTGEIALCAPDGKAISDESATTVTSKPGTVFQHAAGVNGYFVSVYSGAAQQKVPVEVVVHYEPQAG